MSSPALYLTVERRNHNYIAYIFIQTLRVEVTKQYPGPMLLNNYIIAYSTQRKIRNNVGIGSNGQALG